MANDLVIPAGFALVNLFFTGASLPNGAEVTYGLELSGSPTPQEISGQEAGFWEADLKSITTVDVTLDKVRVKFGPNATGPFADTTFDVAGTGGSDELPPNVALLIKKTTGFGGRAGRGRMYYPSVFATDVDKAGNLTSGYRTTLQTAFQAWLDGHTGGTGTLVVLHRTPKTGPIPDPYPILNLSVEAMVATQRRRQRP